MIDFNHTKVYQKLLTEQKYMQPLRKKNINLVDVGRKI